MTVVGAATAELAIGNVLPLSSMPEGTIVCCVEAQQGDRGSYSKAGGTSVTVVSHNEDTGKTRVRLPSGMKKTLPST